MKKTARTRVMFVCLGNACRSPMAEAIATRNAGDVIEASSAGLTPLGHVEEMTKRTLIKNGHLAEGLTSKAISKEAWGNADLVINMSGRRKETAFANYANVEDWTVEDPYGADAELYQRIFENIEQRVAELAGRLRKAKASRSADTKREKIEETGGDKLDGLAEENGA